MTILKDATTGRAAMRGKGLIRRNTRQGVRSDMSPPVVRRRRKLHDPTLCERCGAVYSLKTWRTGQRAAQADPVGAHWTVCPACEQLASGEFFGRVIVRGAYAEANAGAIQDRIRGVAARAGFTQPMRRIVSTERRGDCLEVLTTSQKLAHRIAHALKRGFAGEVTYAWSDRDGELYATWQREDLPVSPAPPRRLRIKGRGVTTALPDIEIQSRGFTLDPVWRGLVERSVERLAERYPELLRIHVTLTHAAHHRHGVEEVAIVANVPGDVLRVAKLEEEIPDAIHAAFLALAKEFERVHRERRRIVKAPGPRAPGSVDAIFLDGGYGFIRLAGDASVYFHRNALHGLEFTALRPGFPVEVDIEEGGEGPQASRVFPVGERGRA